MLVQFLWQLKCSIGFRAKCQSCFFPPAQRVRAARWPRRTPPRPPPSCARSGRWRRRSRVCCCPSFCCRTLATKIGMLPPGLGNGGDFVNFVHFWLFVRSKVRRSVRQSGLLSTESQECKTHRRCPALEPTTNNLTRPKGAVNFPHQP